LRLDDERSADDAARCDQLHPDEALALRQARQLQQLLGLPLRDSRLHRTS
jgi:hypothetical protein